MKALVFLFFITLPLYMTDQFRLTIGDFSLAANMVIAYLLAFSALFISSGNMLKMGQKHKYFFILLSFFILIYIVALLRADELLQGFKLIVKFMGCLLLFASVFFISRNIIWIRDNIGKYLWYFIFSSTLLLLFYLVMNFIVYDNVYLTTNFATGSGEGKNQIQLYLSLVLPLTIVMSIRQRSIPYLIAVLVHLFCLILVGSRALWLAVPVGLLLSFVVEGRIHKTIKYATIIRVGRVTVLALILSLSLIFILVIYKGNVGALIGARVDYFEKKILTTLNITEGETKSTSIDKRKYLLKEGLDSFVKHPILGLGLGDFQSHNKYKLVTHNEYLFYLTDFGLIGFLIFLLLIYIVLSYLYIEKIPLFLLLPFIVDLFFINGSAFPLFWVLLGIYIPLKKHQLF